MGAEDREDRQRFPKSSKRIFCLPARWICMADHACPGVKLSGRVVRIDGDCCSIVVVVVMVGVSVSVGSCGDSSGFVEKLRRVMFVMEYLELWRLKLCSIRCE